MKKSVLLLFAFILIQLSYAEKLALIPYNDIKELKSLLSQKELRVHYTSDEFAVATIADQYNGSYSVLDNSCWTDGSEYYIAWFHKGIKGNYKEQIEGFTEIIAETNDYLFLKTSTNTTVHPPVDGRVVKISNKEIELPQNSFVYKKGTLEVDPDIVSMIEEVDTNIFVANLQHLQDYGTRDAYSSEAVQAQNWIKEQYENMGYAVELFDFTMPNGPASDNVIATKTGTKYPDQYVIIGGHYDSFCYSGDAPGADDDGTGTCGVLEVARVMADYETDRTVIFCAWSGEEYGLYGSEAYADWAADEGMNILGYFNIDMCGYRNPGDEIHTDMFAPSSAQPLVDFYTDICALYIPDFIIDAGTLTGGDSDHTSFNNAGFMGIFPFEDSDNYSPYIHSPDDVIGVSVNSLEMAMLFTQAMVANVATMANWLAPPSNLIAIPGDGSVELQWGPMEDIDQYNIYKNNEPDPIANTLNPYFVDNDVENFTTYSYYVTVIYTETGEESDPSNMVTITPLPPMAFPFFDDFESGALYWEFEGSWGLASNQSYSPSNSITESPQGDYGNSLEISTTLYSFSLLNATNASLSFWTKYALESGYDYTYLEISTNGNNWTDLETFNGNQNSWVQKEYSLNQYLGEPFVLIRFRFFSDSYVTEDGMYIDDLELNVEGLGTGLSPQSINNRINVFPNPFSTSTQIQVETNNPENLEVKIYSLNGGLVKRLVRPSESNGICTFELDGNNLPAGMYYCVINDGEETIVEKIILSK